MMTITIRHRDTEKHGRLYDVVLDGSPMSLNISGKENAEQRRDAYAIIHLREGRKVKYA